jgi:molybdate transport system substrate-binding protein
MQQGHAVPAAAGRHRKRWRITLTLAFLALVALAPAALAACGGGTGSGASSRTEIRVFAAASLTDAFTKLGAQYSAAHPDVKVAFDFAGSQDLVAQLQQGAPADVIATADVRTMDAVATLTEAPRMFARNQLEIIVATDGPQHVAGLADLSRADLKVVLADPTVPAGKYAQQVLQAAGVAVKPVSLEDSVKGVVTKVSLGEADAGIVYVTDVRAAGDSVAGVEIPAAQNATAVYPIARVRASAHQQQAQGFIDLVLSAEGQRILRDAGFLAPTP